MIGGGVKRSQRIATKYNPTQYPGTNIQRRKSPPSPTVAVFPTKSQQNRNKIATNSHEKTHEKIANNLRRWLIFSGDAFIISGAPSPATPEMKPIHSTLPSTCTSASKTVLSRMQLTLNATRRTPHGAWRLVLAMFAWSVKTRHAPSRHCRDARVYGHTTTAMHDNEYTPPRRLLRPRFSLSSCLGPEGSITVQAPHPTSG